MNYEWPYGILFVNTQIRGLVANGPVELLLAQAWRNAWMTLEAEHGVLGGRVADRFRWLVLWEWAPDQEPVTTNIAMDSIALAVERSLEVKPRLETIFEFVSDEEEGQPIGRLTVCNVDESGEILNTVSLELRRDDDKPKARWISAEGRSVELLRTAAAACLDNVCIPAHDDDIRMPFEVDPVETIERFNREELQPVLDRLVPRLQDILNACAGRQLGSIERQRKFAEALTFALKRLNKGLSTGDGQVYLLQVTRQRNGGGIFEFQAQAPGKRYGSAPIPPADRLTLVNYPASRRRHHSKRPISS